MPSGRAQQFCQNKHLIQEEISEPARGKTIITITHRPETVRNADRSQVAENGGIAGCGTHEEPLCRGGRYRRFTEIRESAEGCTSSCISCQKGR